MRRGAASLRWILNPVLTEPAIFACSQRLGQGKNHDRRRAASAKEPGDDAGRGGDVLLAFDLVADDAAADRAAGVESVECLAIARVNREKVIIEIAGEQHAARGHGD